MDGLLAAEPELALVIACVYEMGDRQDGREIEMWREMFRRMESSMLQRYRRSMPELVEAILEQSEGMESFRELYFSLVIPVAAAMRAGERELAKKILTRRLSPMEMSVGYIDERLPL